jgi:hypothetical protein
VDDVMGLSIVASSQVSQALSQNSFAFQFGSISPGFGSLGVGKSTAMSYPLRTNSAPPNLDEQKWDQTRFDVRPTEKAPPVAAGHQQPQVHGEFFNVSSAFSIFSSL